ncbi:HAD family hydrolase [Virgibacillus sp. NKC19-3]|uniref:D-glycero-alpha-D-manno-heptose-1,7-bisphosphate 7-phosphatase n=1 Tax=Virgibacillus saliphilus TaxID=2831674 RepID=UPI001C9B4D10|nr:HAD family hydrolase [Virgibacillus sp. NKC19-3]MBY7145025.1 HAD family hydrolase [Virgibacillus sp. NKC19-3]
MSIGMFLDRDGVINEVLTNRVKYVNTPEDFYLLDGVGEAIRCFNMRGFKVFVVTNQGGIGLGLMSQSELYAIHKKMEADLATFGARLDDIAYCPHKPHANCAYRKPNPQMILDLAKKHDIDLEKSYMVGDRASDIQAGKAAGLKTMIIGNRQETKADADMFFPDLISVAKWLG